MRPEFVGARAAAGRSGPQERTEHILVAAASTSHAR